MSGFSFVKMAEQLNTVQKQETDPEQEEGVTFEDKQLTWDTADDVKDVVEALNNKKTVHFLKLDGNTLGIDAAKAIGKALERHTEFRKALWKNMFTRRLKTEIPIALKHLGEGLMTAKAQLTVLDLSDNALGPNGMVGLEDLLRSPVCFSLQELHLNNCGLGIGGGRMLSAAILDCHRNSIAAGTPLNLKVFITGRNRLENDGARAIADIFATLKTLEVIAMPQNSIYHKGIAALAKGISQNPNLRVLNLNDNTVTQKGASVLADVFETMHNLREINFGDCLLKTNGAFHFATALEDSNPNIETIDLSFNEINSEGGISLVKALRNKSQLKYLNIDGNIFGTDGRQQVLEEWQNNCINPLALQTFDEDNSDSEPEEEFDDDDDEEEDDDDDDDNNENENVSDNYDQYEANDTTEEADDYDDEATAYVTAALTTKTLNDTNNTTINKSVTFSEDNNKNLPATAASFCLSQEPCTLQMFESLKESNKLQAFKEIIDQFTEDNHLLLLIFTALKCAQLSKQSQEALNIAKALYKESFDYALNTKQERRVSDYYLKQLGLLRTEDKFKPVYDIKNCRYALKETLKDEEITSFKIKNTFNVFLSQLDA